MKKKKLLNIQYLRGFAALTVCGFHTKYWLNNTITEDFGEKLFPSGEYGVEIFFVISGFIMMYTTQNTTIENPLKNIISFLKKRIIRISPLYTILTLAWFFLFVYPLYSINYISCVKIIKSILYIPYHDLPILYLGWTLNFEMFFYIVFAFAFWFRKFRIHALFAFFIFQITLHNFSFESPYLKLIASPIITYFFLGVLIGHILNRYGNFTVHRHLRTFSFIIFALMQLEVFTISNSYLQMIVIGLNCLIIFAYDLKAEDKSIKPLFFLGNISFSLYLLHPFVPNILIAYFNIKPGFLNNEFYTFSFYILMLSTTIGLSYLSYEFFERRLIKYLKF